MARGRALLFVYFCFLIAVVTAECDYDYTFYVYGLQRQSQLDIPNPGENPKWCPIDNQGYSRGVCSFSPMMYQANGILDV